MSHDRDPPSRFWLGAALAALSAVGFASKGIFAKFLYAEGWSADTVIAFALP